MRILSNNFFSDIENIDKIYDPGFIAPIEVADLQDGSTIMKNLQGEPDMLETCDRLWRKDYKQWCDLFRKATEYVPTVCQEFNLDRDNLSDIWCSFNKDIWNLEKPEAVERSNADVHLDYFSDYTSVINLQIFMSPNVPPEAGTCFWRHTGETVDRKPIGDGGIMNDIPGQWMLTEQVPFARNTAFLYNAGPGGEYHSAPLTEDLINKEVPSHERVVIIIRYRFK